MCFLFGSLWRQVSCHWKYFNNDLELLGLRFFYVTDVHCPFCLFELKVNIIFKSTRIHLFLKELLVMFSKKLWPAWIKTTVATYWWGELVSFGLCCCYSVKFTQADLCLGKYLNSLIEKKFGLIYYETHDLFYFLEVPCSVLNMPTTHEYHFLSIRLNQHSLVHVSLKGKLATIYPIIYLDNI